MKKTRIILALALITILVTGCDMLVKKNPTKDISSPIDYNKGTKALEVEILENMPPEEIYEYEDFTIGVAIRNTGRYDVEEAEISLAGLVDMYFDVEKEDYKEKINLKGRSQDNPEGELKFIQINAKNKGIPLGMEEYDASFDIGLFYSYETIASAEVCVNPNALKNIKLSEDLCEMKDVRLSSQGAPIAVKKVEQYISSVGSKLRANYEIYLDNVGDGKLTFDKIKLEEAMLSTNELTCKNYIIEDFNEQKEPKFVCYRDISNEEGTYSTILSVKLSYDYKTVHQGEITIKK